jgi:hypothetical protein
MRPRLRGWQVCRAVGHQAGRTNLIRSALAATPGGCKHERCRRRRRKHRHPRREAATTSAWSAKLPATPVGQQQPHAFRMRRRPRAAAVAPIAESMAHRSACRPARLHRHWDLAGWFCSSRYARRIPAGSPERVPKRALLTLRRLAEWIRARQRRRGSQKWHRGSRARRAQPRGELAHCAAEKAR